jgi:hypothetical protein
LITWTQALQAGAVSPDDALALFDSLEPVGGDFMLGAWRGSGFPTGHPLDGSLEAYHWWGKRFESAEAVHPLVFERRNGRLISLHPLWMLPVFGVLDRWHFPQGAWVGRLLQLLMPLLATRQSRARLRELSHRGQVTAAMVYDHLPINDVFRRVDADTVLGLMDQKGSSRMFFFVLRRQPPSPVR